MPSINDMPDEQIAGFFYLALWNEEIAKALVSYPNATPVLKQTGLTGFYLWSQKFGYHNAAASQEIIRESVNFISNYSTILRTIDQKIEFIAHKLPLLKHSDEQHFNNVLLCWFGALAGAAKAPDTRVIKNCLELLHKRMTAYVLKCKANDTIDVSRDFMPALSNAILRCLGAERLNFIKTIMAVSFFDANHKISILKDQNMNLRQSVVEHIKKTHAISVDSNAILQVFNDELPRSKQENGPTEGLHIRRSFS